MSKLCLYSIVFTILILLCINIYAEPQYADDGGIDIIVNNLRSPPPSRPKKASRRNMKGKIDLFQEEHEFKLHNKKLN